MAISPAKLGFVLSTFAIVVSAVAAGPLQVGFYSKRCPNAESIVKNVVRGAVAADRHNAAALLRVHFHDCFVEGCDASILVDNGPNSEMHAFGHQGVHGFEIIEAAKSQLEKICPGVVSCADIVALAARDSIVLSNGPFYAVQTGRRDGRVSDLTLAKDMPDVHDPIGLLKSKFKRKGLSDKDLVLLSSAHTIGSTACFFVTDRLFNFTKSGGSDPDINHRFLPKLKSTCPLGGNPNVRLPLDPVTEFKFDVQILLNMKNGFTAISSDARLYNDKNTKKIIDSYVQHNNKKGSSVKNKPHFMADFGTAMVKMGQIGAKTGAKGEIRRVCRSFN